MEAQGPCRAGGGHAGALLAQVFILRTKRSGSEELLLAIRWGRGHRAGRQKTGEEERVGHRLQHRLTEARTALWCPLTGQVPVEEGEAASSQTFRAPVDAAAAGQTSPLTNRPLCAEVQWAWGPQRVSPGGGVQRACWLTQMGVSL